MVWTEEEKTYRRQIRRCFIYLHDMGDFGVKTRITSHALADIRDEWLTVWIDSSRACDFPHAWEATWRRSSIRQSPPSQWFGYLLAFVDACRYVKLEPSADDYLKVLDTVDALCGLDPAE